MTDKKDADGFLRIKRRRVLMLDKNDKFLEKGDMVEFKKITWDGGWKTLIGLLIGPGKLLRSNSYNYRTCSILWDNGGIGNVSSDKLTLFQKGVGPRRDHPLPPLKPNNKKTRAQRRRIPKTVRRSRGHRR